MERKTLLHAVTPAAIDRGMASLSTPVQCQPDQLVVHLITTPQFFLLLQPAPAVKPEGLGIISLTSCTVIVNTAIRHELLLLCVLACSLDPA